MAEDLIMNYASVFRAMELVKAGQKPYIHQYLLNPSLSRNDIYFIIGMFIFIVLLRFILAGAYHAKTRRFRCLFCQFVKHIKSSAKRSKFNENLWYTCWHSFSFAFGLYALSEMALTAQNPGWSRLLLKEKDVKWYLFPTKAELRAGNLGWPTFPMTSLTKTYYLTELSFWISCIFYICIETIRSDFYALLLHHNITCFLILLSYCLSFWRLGTVILVIHDIADIALYSTKAVYYSNVSHQLVDILFALFALVFFFSRLVVFPFLCLKPALDLRNVHIWTKGIIRSHWQIPGGLILPSFLCILQMLHIFWFGLILKLIWRSFQNQKMSQCGDIRSNSESESSADEIVDDISSESFSSHASQNSCILKQDRSQRMHLSSLPGVIATLSKEELKLAKNKQLSNKVINRK